MRLPTEIENDYYVYSKLVKVEFYEKFINKINSDNLKALKPKGTKKKKYFLIFIIVCIQQFMNIVSKKIVRVQEP